MEGLEFKDTEASPRQSPGHPPVDISSLYEGSTILNFRFYSTDAGKNLDVVCGLGRGVCALFAVERLPGGGMRRRKRAGKNVNPATMQVARPKDMT